MAAISVSRTTSSNSLYRFFPTASWPVRGTPRCRKNPKPRKPSCAKSSSPLPFRCDPRPVSVIAIILMSGILSSITLSGVAMRLQLPEHIFAGQPVRASIELENEKLTLPSFSLRVEAVAAKNSPPAALLETPVYFPYLPKRGRVNQSVPMTFPARGVYRQEAFRIVTRFPFGFLQKAHRVDLRTDALVYPSVEPTREFFEIMPGLQGAIESRDNGRGQNLYALRDYVPTDSARHVHWKASARLGSLMVREFTREDETRVLLVLDPHVFTPEGDSALQSAA